MYPSSKRKRFFATSGSRPKPQVDQTAPTTTVLKSKNVTLLQIFQRSIFAPQNAIGTGTGTGTHMINKYGTARYGYPTVYLRVLPASPASFNAVDPKLFIPAFQNLSGDN
jgi:hypothetical protein